MEPSLATATATGGVALAARAALGGLRALLLLAAAHDDLLGRGTAGLLDVVLDKVVLAVLRAAAAGAAAVCAVGLSHKPHCVRLRWWLAPCTEDEAASASATHEKSMSGFTLNTASRCWPSVPTTDTKCSQRTCLLSPGANGSSFLVTAATSSPLLLLLSERAVSHAAMAGAGARRRAASVYARYTPAQAWTTAGYASTASMWRTARSSPSRAMAATRSAGRTPRAAAATAPASASSCRDARLHGATTSSSHSPVCVAVRFSYSIVSSATAGASSGALVADATSASTAVVISSTTHRVFRILFSILFVLLCG